MVASYWKRELLGTPSELVEEQALTPLQREVPCATATNNPSATHQVARPPGRLLVVLELSSVAAAHRDHSVRPVAVN